MIATGICGSDFHGYSGENGRRHPGQVMGHETVGRIDELGSGVTGLAVGQLVTVNPVMGCGACAACAMVSSSGAAGEWCSVWRRRSRRRSQTGSPSRRRTSWSCRRDAGRARSAGGTACGGLSRRTPWGCRPPMTGCWSSAAARSGRRACWLPGGWVSTNLAVSDVSSSRRELCARLGAQVIDPTADDLAEAVAASSGSGQLVIDAVGVNRTVADAFAASGLGSRIVLVGMGSPQLELSAYAVSTEERTLIGSFTYTAADFSETAAWVGTVPDGIEALIDGRVGWDEAPQSFDDLARGRSTASKILVFPQGADRGTAATGT